MCRLFLPADHSTHDLVLAGLVSGVFSSGELYVTCSRSGGPAAPTVAATLRERRAGGIAGEGRRVLAALRGAFGAWPRPVPTPAGSRRARALPR